MGVNKVILLGNVGNEPEVRYLERQKCVARIRVATNEYYTNDRGETITQTEWHTVIFWGKAAQNIEKYVHKRVDYRLARTRILQKIYTTLPRSLLVVSNC